MTKSTQSHENNTSNISATPFLDSWKSTLLAQAKLLGIAVKPASSLDFKAISASIDEHLLQQNSPVNNSKTIVNTGERFASVFTAQEQLYLQKAKSYNIELDGDQWCQLTDLHMYDAVDSWEKALKEAMYLGVDWKMSDYDPQGLELAMAEAEELPNSERQQVNAYYYSTRGC